MEKNGSECIIFRVCVILNNWVYGPLSETRGPKCREREVGQGISRLLNLEVKGKGCFNVEIGSRSRAGSPMVTGGKQNIWEHWPVGR